MERLLKQQNLEISKMATGNAGNVVISHISMRLHLVFYMNLLVTNFEQNRANKKKVAGQENILPGIMSLTAGYRKWKSVRP